MKKILLFILVLLPFLGIGQTQLVRWNGSNGTNYSNAPSVLVSNVSANNASGTNSFTPSVANFFRGTDYTKVNAPDASQFMEFSIRANNGFDINLSTFNFAHISTTNGARNFVVRYSDRTDVNAVWTDLGTFASSTTETSQSIDLSGLTVVSNSTFYIRIFPYNAIQNDGNDRFSVRHGAASQTNTSGTTGPRFFGTVVTRCTPQGDPSVYGSNTWIGYVYDWIAGPQTLEDPTPNNYLGYVTEAQTFDRDNGTGAISGATTVICGTPPSGSFLVRYRMNVNVTGKFAITVGGDDGYRLSVDGGATWEINNWSQHSYQTTTKEICLNGSTNVVLEYFEGPVDSRISFSYVDVTPVAPSTLTSTSNSICSGTQITLTANGTSADGVNTFYQWGTGTVGSNIISGQTGSSINVSPTSTTTYWVRVTRPADCVFNTAAVTREVTVTPQAVIPTSLTTPNATICSGTQITLTANGTSGTYQWGTGATVGNNIISNESASTLVVSPTANTTYWVRVLATSPCTTNSGGRTLAITVSGVPPVNPTSITGTTTICTGTGTTLTAVGSSGTYQWGIGSTVGSNIISGATSSTLNTGNLTSTTTYWVRVVGAAPCANSDGITTTVTVIPQAVRPTSLTTPNATICSGTQITLTANGTSGTYQWGTGATVGNNIISNESASTLVVSPTASTTYWVRVLATSPCTTNSGGRTLAITVSGVPPVNPTSITGTTTICTGTGTTLTAVGSSGTYQWGTGSTVGSNPIAGQTTNTLNTGNLTSTTTYWVRVVGTAPCVSSAGITTTVNVIPQATRPSSITSTSTNICSGTQITLTANGTYTSGSYQWGTGTAPNNVITGETGNTLVVSPTANTTYWVRILAATPCTTNTAERTIDITVIQPATAPTAITGIETSYCPNGPVILTATGGTGTKFQWGTGSVVGTNPIAGTTNSITVNPSSTTTYWVRRENTSPCSGFTSGVTKTVTVLPIPGDPAVFGDNEWNVYGYSSGGNANPTGYRGYYVQNLGSNVGMDTKLKWAAQASPSSASDWQGCPITAGSTYTFVHKRKGFPCGKYLLTYTYYDDDTVIIIKDANGVTSTINSTSYYNGGAGLSRAVNGTTTYALDANSTIEIRTTNIGGEAKLGIIFTGASTSIYNGTWNQDASYTDIEIQSDYSLPADLTVCKCTVIDGKTFTVPSDKTLTVIGNTTALGTGKFIIENKGAFVQVNDNATYTGASTSFTSKRTTQPVFRYDFTYWSSPVEDFILKSVSPFSLYDKFFSWNNITQAWLAHKTNLAPHTMIIGKGYSIRAPQSFDIEGASGATAKLHTAQFIGKPNTGTKTITVSNGAANKWNLIGNPYPSAINVVEFLKLNKDVVDGTLYFWTHKSPVIQNSANPDYAVYSSTDYIAVNLSGNVSNESGVVSSSPTGSPYGLGAGSPFDNIASGQGFFVKGKETGVTGSQVTFKNSMRVRVGGRNNQFFKPGITTPVKDWEITGKHRIWLNIKTAQNDFNQALVGYIQHATNGLDWGYDGEVFSGGNVSLYSLLDSKGLTIQARALPFSAQDQVPLGYATTQTGVMNISIDHFDGLFFGQNIYLEDKVLNVVHNLKNASYSFTSAAGTFNTRFVLRYLPQDNLSTEIPTLDANSIVVFNTNNQISIKAKDLIIDQVFIYDLTGRLLFTKNNVNAEEFITNSLTASNQVILVKVITDTKAEVVKKVIMK